MAMVIKIDEKKFIARFRTVLSKQN